MFNNSSKILFLIMMIISSLIVVSANSWLGMWMGLEINLLAFIPLMSDSYNLMSTEASLVYFLTQALASSVLLLGIVLLMIEQMNILLNFSNLPCLLISSSLLMKMGAAPFHLWFPMVVEGLSWINVMILLTWQKMASLVMISYVIPNKLIMISVIISVAVGSIGGLNQTSLKKLMAYSSINHLGWMLVSTNSSEILWANYYFLYCFISISIILFFYLFNISSINQLFYSAPSASLKFFMFFNILSLGGLPPFLGFLPKWMTIQMLTFNSQFFLLIIMLMFSLITLFFYLRVCYSAFMFNHSSSNWTLSYSMNKFILFILFIWSSFSSLGLMFLGLIFMLM